jgi:erythromycin esterase
MKAKYSVISLLCLLLAGMLLTGCQNGSKTTLLSPQAAALAWLKQHALVLKTTDPAAPLDDLSILRPLIGNASIVGLGEATHGSHEFFAMKQRLFEFLVEKMGFTMMVMEGSWSVGEQINQYIVEGKGTAQHVLQLFQFWTWNTQEVLDLLQWMRAYNLDPRHQRKIAFAGFDCQMIDSTSYDSVIAYFRAVDPQRVATVTALYRELHAENEAGVGTYEDKYRTLPLATRERYYQQAFQVYTSLSQQQRLYEQRSSPQRFARVLQEARVILQHTHTFGSSPNTGYRLREQSMAENIAWLHTQTPAGAKMVLWAHDIHIATTDDTTMGTYIRQRYGAQYLAIGMSFYTGLFNAHGLDSKNQATPVQPFSATIAEPQSYNNVFGHVGPALYAIDLCQLPNGAAGQWLRGPRDLAMIGSVYNIPKSTGMNPWPLVQTFDIVIHIQHVTASHLLPFTL